MSNRRTTPVADWLAQTRVTDNPEGDLVAEMRRKWRDGEMPDTFPNIAAMRTCVLRFKHYGAVLVVPGVWRRYCKWRDRQGAVS